MTLPYSDPETGRTSGHSGTDTSAARAHREDASGTTAERQNYALREMRLQGTYGLTVKELRDDSGMHHGQASAVLSNLHKTGQAVRLTMVREGCKVYVLTRYQMGRESEPFVPRVRKVDLALARRLREALAGVHPDYCASHAEFLETCPHCRAGRVLAETRDL